MISSRFLRRARIAALVVLSAGCSRAVQVASPSYNAGFLRRFGTDTLAVERFTRYSDRIEGEMVTRVPRLTRTTYLATVEPSGAVSRVETVRYGGLGTAAPVTQRVTAVVRNDTAHLTIVRNDSTINRAVAVQPRTIAMLSGSVAMDEMGATMAAAAPAGGASVAYYAVGAEENHTAHVVRFAGDSLRLVADGDTLRARVDESGRILSAVNSPAQGIRTTIERISWSDAGNLAQAFAARLGGGGLGPLSPRDTVRASVGGASVLVDYSRPSKRGRTIFGGIVPWDTVWRTGANEATTLVTDKDLMIGGTHVPAGTYTLYSRPSASGWKLIVNKNTGQWGTEYKQEHDLARIPLTVEKVSTPVERFTIAIESQSSGGVIRLRWDDTEAWVPFTVNP
ncbi:MAG: DUF2911 domain-containing protein [Gemmatimonadaceae bacterium]